MTAEEQGGEGASFSGQIFELRANVEKVSAVQRFVASASQEMGVADAEGPRWECCGFFKKRKKSSEAEGW